LIEPVLYHNAEDILSLLGLVISGASILQDEDLCEADGMDFFGAGKVLEKLGRTEKAADFFQRALDGDLSDEVGLSTRRRLSHQFKKNQDWEKAVSLWREMAAADAPSSDLLYSLRELSMFFEHREKKFDEAFRLAEEGYVVSLGFSVYYEKDFSRRRERLKRKMKGLAAKT
jgi:tetratricopeptide (TPR) repeat protein